MIRTIQTILLVLCLLISLHATGLRAADNLYGLVNALGLGSMTDTEEKVRKLVATGDPKVVLVLEALAEGELFFRKSDNGVFLTRKSGSNYALIDPVTGASAGEEPKSALTKIKVNNSLRRMIRTSLGGLTLLSTDKTVRLEAARSILKAPDGETLGMIESALTSEKDAEVRKVLDEARAASLLASDRPIEEKRAAIQTIRASGSRGTPCNSYPPSPRRPIPRSRRILIKPSAG